MSSSSDDRLLSATGRALMMAEAIHSTAMEHPDDCGCVTCRAASGDYEAIARLYAAAAREADQ